MSSSRSGIPCKSKVLVISSESPKLRHCVKKELIHTSVDQLSSLKFKVAHKIWGIKGAVIQVLNNTLILSRISSHLSDFTQGIVFITMKCLFYRALKNWYLQAGYQELLKNIIHNTIFHKARIIGGLFFSKICIYLRIYVFVTTTKFLPHQLQFLELATYIDFYCHCVCGLLIFLNCSVVAETALTKTSSYKHWVSYCWFIWKLKCKFLTIFSF